MMHWGFIAIILANKAVTFITENKTGNTRPKIKQLNVI